MKELISKTIQSIFLDDRVIVFRTTDGDLGYETGGDCCSVTYLHDFLGVAYLLNGSPVTKVEEIEVDKTHTEKENEDKECTSWYGYRIVTTHPQLGEVNAVLSFRNESNGYYGGWLETTRIIDTTGLRKITEDWIND